MCTRVWACGVETDRVPDEMNTQGELADFVGGADKIIFKSGSVAAFQPEACLCDVDVVATLVAAGEDAHADEDDPTMVWINLFNEPAD